MTEVGCYSSVQLAKFLIGTCDPSERSAIQAHLAACELCQSTVAEIDQSSTVMRIDAIGGSPADSPLPRSDSGQRMGDSRGELKPTAIYGDELEMKAPAQQDQIGPYRILARLGEGGMGTVYKAVHVKLEKLVALKVIKHFRDANAVARFEREMKALGRLQHQHIVQAFDAGESNGTHYLVVEFVGGLDLAQLAKSLGPLPIPDACELIRQAALGLQYAHEHSLVHRDIKPSNLMLSPDGCVKILDLGLALFRDLPTADTDELTSTNQLLGTVDYMAPEQTADAHDVDIRADIYSLGATLYKLLSGRAPFDRGKIDPVRNKLLRKVHEDVPSIRDQRADVPSSLAAIVKRMLDRVPDRRFPVPLDVADALAPFATGCDLSGLLERAQQHPGPRRGTGNEPHGRSKSSSPSRAKTAAVSVIGAVLLLACLLWLNPGVIWNEVGESNNVPAQEKNLKSAAKPKEVVEADDSNGSTWGLTLVETLFDGQQDGDGTLIDGLQFTHAVTVSSDGNHVYVAGGQDNAIAVFSRNETSGRLKFVECLKNGRPDGSGTRVDGLGYVTCLALSLDGQHMYAGGHQDNSIAAFERDANSGKLSFVGVYRESLKGVYSVSISADGRSVYAASTNADSIVLFKRNSTSGELSFEQSLKDGEQGVTGLSKVFWVMASPDNKHVYTAGLFDNAVTVFRRNQSTGRLTFVEVLNGLTRSVAVVVCPDGRHVYSAGREDNALVMFNRDEESGQLAIQQVLKDGESDGHGHIVDGISNVSSIAISQDGKFLFTAGLFDHGVGAFSRDTTNGRLTFLTAAKDDGTDKRGTKIDGLRAAHSVAVSPDGRHVYAAGRDDNAVVVFAWQSEE